MSDNLHVPNIIKFILVFVSFGIFRRKYHDQYTVTCGKCIYCPTGTLYIKETIYLELMFQSQTLPNVF